MVECIAVFAPAFEGATAEKLAIEISSLRIMDVQECHRLKEITLGVSSQSKFQHFGIKL